jgi:hypothetical protein
MQADELKRLAEAIVSPLGILTIVFGAGLLLRMLRRRSWLGHRLLVVGTALWLVGTFVPVAELAISWLERAYPPVARIDGLTVERIVILSHYAVDNAGFPVTNNVSPHDVRPRRELPTLSATAHTDYPKRAQAGPVAAAPTPRGGL